MDTRLPDRHLVLRLPSHVQKDLGAFASIPISPGAIEELHGLMDQPDGTERPISDLARYSIHSIPAGARGMHRRDLDRRIEAVSAVMLPAWVVDASFLDGFNAHPVSGSWRTQKDAVLPLLAAKSGGRSGHLQGAPLPRFALHLADIATLRGDGLEASLRQILETAPVESALLFQGTHFPEELDGLLRDLPDRLTRDAFAKLLAHSHPELRRAGVQMLGKAGPSSSLTAR